MDQLILLAAALLGFLVFFFLPTILELKRPKDKGPRMIVETTIEGILGGSYAASQRLESYVGLGGLENVLTNVESEESAESGLSVAIASLLDFAKLLPDMEIQ